MRRAPRFNLGSPADAVSTAMFACPVARTHAQTHTHAHAHARVRACAYAHTAQVFSTTFTSSTSGRLSGRNWLPSTRRGRPRYRVSSPALPLCRRGPLYLAATATRRWCYPGPSIYVQACMPRLSSSHLKETFESKLPCELSAVACCGLRQHLLPAGQSSQHKPAACSERSLPGHHPSTLGNAAVSQVPWSIYKPRL